VRFATTDARGLTATGQSLRFHPRSSAFICG
jgi:hypothetical protein